MLKKTGLRFSQKSWIRETEERKEGERRERQNRSFLQSVHHSEHKVIVIVKHTDAHTHTHTHSHTHTQTEPSIQFTVEWEN
jgi:hypothetical protein